MNDNHRYQWLFRDCPAFLASIDADGRYVDVSDAFLQRLGYAREELVGHRPQEHMTSDAARRMTEEYLPRFLRTGRLTNVPTNRVTKYGEVVEFVLNASARRDGEGNLLESVVIFAERVEQARIERHYQQLYRQTPAMLHTTGRDGCVEAVSDYWLQKMGYRRDDVIGAPAVDFLTEASQEQAAQCIPRAFETGVLHEERLDFATKGGDVLETLLSASAERDEQGNVRRMLAVVEDVTARNQAEAAKQKAFEEIARLNEELKRERDYLREEVRVALNFGQVVGSSTAIERVLEQVELVAPTDANVVIFGESGTGKELIASAIHERSERRDHPMVRVNCGAIPSELFESEFFGHVKGAFTGALKNRTGRFELADGGTLFLDEVAEIPLDLQSKLLRVLQEGEFERVGEDRTRKVNVRVIAATNRDLKAEMQAKRFREDLFFRLNVVPVEIPPLRHRLEDVPQLAAHFIRLASQKLRRPTPRLTEANLLQLQRYDWPGNIRELQNVIERAVILSQDGRLSFDLPHAVGQTMSPGPGDAVAAAAPRRVTPEAERKKRNREEIIAALAQAKGKVFGPGGAAELLGVKPTTLASRMKALGIRRPSPR